MTDEVMPDAVLLPEVLLRHYARLRTEETFLALYRAVSPAVFGFALRLTGGERAPAEDLLQEAWTRAIERAHVFDGNSVSRWICGIVVNCWHEQHRRDLREQTVPGNVLDTMATLADADWSELPVLQRAVDSLPPGCRAVLLLHDVEGYTHEEIAQLLMIVTGTSKSQLFRARRRLRALLGGDGSFATPAKGRE